MEVVLAVISGGTAILIAVIEALAAKDRKRSQEDREKTLKEHEAMAERAKLRAEESMIAMQLNNASCKLSLVTAKAVTHQQLNGDVQEAIDAALKAQEKYDTFLHSIAAKAVSSS